MITSFAEHTLRFSLELRPDGSVRRRSAVRRGACLEEHHGPGEVVHRFADGDELLREPRRRVERQVADAAREVQERPHAEAGPEAEDALRALSRETGLTLVLSGLHQHVAAGGDGAARTGERLVCTLEAAPGPGAAGSEAVPWRPDLPLAANLAEAGRAVERVRARESARRTGEVPAGRDLVLRPGRAGAFFHELVGHPMEADVLRSGTGYLAPLAGRRVAPEWLSVVDGATRAAAGYRAAFDDEGTPCSEVALIDRGVVGRPMTDLATARLTGQAPTGHGRRLDYRHPAIPRMTHTCALADATAEPAPHEWIEPCGLLLESMNLATGAFAFLAPAPLLRRQDGPPLRLPPLRIAGDALRVLAALSPSDPGVAEYARARRGCGKLGQFPLLVTFANSGVRLPAHAVSIEAVPDA
ncbi:TldD protein [Thermocatellispora tengchongensis]|uniref:TldD protein n=1 Tax=Thermocatellispora tengchongensis TaxID=1073253 RepID=A0A840PB22_9ACTN|nr:metallopeptidase TldD-related protein [Thermocatellispora tengchongensis]MBB5134387.1 TldD protein [Thermocatellispora tengchongensis]